MNPQVRISSRCGSTPLSPAYNNIREREGEGETATGSSLPNMKAGEEGDELHIAMLPWLAFGHFHPFLHLSKSLLTSTARCRRLKVSFLSTPRNLARLPTIPPHLSSHLHLVPLPMPNTVDGLPPAAEATVDIPPDKMDHLKLAADQLAGPLSAFLVAGAPDVIICDFFFSWLPPLAHSHGVRAIFFSICHAATLAYIPTGEVPATWPSSPADLTSPAPWIPFPTKVTFRRHEADYFYRHYLPNSTGVSDATRVRAVIAGADAVIVRSCIELESDFLRLLPELFNKPVLPVGLLLPDDAGGGGCGGGEIEWLDGQPVGTTVYVAFGSEVKLGHEQVTELAMGLEMAGLPFIWAYRDGPENLPMGFEERVMGRGLVVRGWAPQMLILAHRAVGGFLTHCGTSSLVEGVGQGKPLVGLPMTVDQGLNCRAMVERGFGVEVARDEISGSFTREDVARAVRLVLVDVAGGPIRARVLEMKKVFSSDDWNQAYVDKLVHFLEQDPPGGDIYT